MKLIKNKQRKGFTLIELLVVIAIIAVLAVVVILTLNPAELLRQARDSNRISDFATLKSAISLFQADVSTSSVSALGTYTVLYGTSGMIGPTSNFTGAPGWGYATTSVSTLSSSTSRAVDSTGWIKINFTAISSGAPIGSLPVDPSNNSTNFYTFAASSTIFKMATLMESAKFKYLGSGDVVSTDGGLSSTTYEAGTGLGL